MGYIIKNTAGLINTRITDAGRQKLSQGSFNISYFQVGDSEVTYTAIPNYNPTNFFVLEPSFNAQNASGAPQSNKQNIKYPFYVDGNKGNTYGIANMNSIVSPVYNRAAERGFFQGTSIVDTNNYNWSALTNNLYAINSNYVVQMNTLTGGTTIDITFNSCNPSSVRNIAIGDLITIYYDGNGLYDCNCSNLPTPTPTPTISVTPSTSPVVVVSPTPSPTSTNTNPCGSPTPTPTPSATFCLTPTPSNPCPQPPPPDCVVSMSSCYPILTYKVVNVCFNTITLDRETPDYSYLTGSCYGRVIVYPPNMTSLYDSITPSNHWSDSVINFESVCYTDQFDVKIWNMNIPWSENPAGLDPSVYKDYTTFGSENYLGTKEYFGYESSSGQTDTDSTYYFNSFDEKIIVQPEDQKAIAIIHYTNQTIDLFYGEKFALEPFDISVDDTTGQARNFKLHIPWIMWHKNPECCYGQTFWVDPPGFDNFKLFEVHYLKSTKNSDMNDPGIRYYHLWDTNPNIDGKPNRVGKVFPDSQLIVVDDEELIAALSYKSNRNWTLPAPQVSLITPNTCGNDNSSVIGVLTGSNEYMYVTYRLSNSNLFTDYLHCNYYSSIQGPNLSCTTLGSQNVALRFGDEFGCLGYPNVTTTTTLPYDTCYLTGFTMYIQQVIDVYSNVFFEPTGNYLNGQPIFYSPINSLNIYYNGSQWLVESTQLDAVVFLNTPSPIGSFETEDFASGYTICEEALPLCIETCFVNEVCDQEILPRYLFYGDYVYTSGIGTVQYSAATYEWVVVSSDTVTILATLSGLTENDIPSSSSWTIIEPTLTGITTTTGYCSVGCQCVSYTGDSVTNILKYMDCNGLISDDITLSLGETYTACTLDILGSYYFGNLSGSTSFEACGETCPSTTTTTTCPPTCDLTSKYYADTFEIICQKVLPSERPNSSEWRVIDFTSQLSASTINGFITPQSLTATTFVITDNDYENASTYSLNYLGLPSAGSTGTSLNFGDEYYFYGNLETDIQATIYEMRYKVNLGATEFLAPSNPTWSSGIQPHISEIGLYDSDKNLMIISKLQSPYPRTGVQQFLIKFDF